MVETSLSLLDRLGNQSDSESWDRLIELYRPLLYAWLRRYDELQPSDADDLVQDVLLVVTRELPGFQHNRQRGAFRSWLRKILVLRLRNFWRSRQRQPIATGDSGFLRQLDELEDDVSRVSQVWNRQHDEHVLHRLLGIIETRFAAHTWRAFRMHVFEGCEPEQVASELDISLDSVYAAKSRVLNALRQEGRGLFD